MCQHYGKDPGRGSHSSIRDHKQEPWLSDSRGEFLLLFFIFSLNVSGSGMGALSTLDFTSSLELSTVSGT